MLSSEEYYKRRVEGDLRKTGAKNLAEFIDRISAGKDISDPAVLSDEVKHYEHEDFIDVLKRLNGVLSSLPINFRKNFHGQNSVSSSASPDNLGNVTWRSPSSEMQREISKSFFSRLKNLAAHAATGDKNYQRALSRSLFFYVNMLHQFPDANGRTARALYLLFSPDIAKDMESLKKHLYMVVSKKIPEVARVFNGVTEGYFLGELEHRGYLHSSKPEDIDKILFAAVLNHPKFAGFYINQLGYLAADSILDENEKREVAKYNSELKIYTYKFSKFSPRIQDLFKQKLSQEAVKMTTRILRVSADPESDWTDVFEDLDRAMAFKED